MQRRPGKNEPKVLIVWPSALQFVVTCTLKDIVLLCKLIKSCKQPMEHARYFVRFHRGDKLWQSDDLRKEDRDIAVLAWLNLTPGHSIEATREREWA